MSHESEILAALSQVMDPDLNKDIVSLGFIKDLQIKKGLLGSLEVSFTVELTTPACPVKDLLKQQAEEAVLKIPSVKKVTVTMSAQVRTATFVGQNPNYPNQKTIPGVKTVIAVGSGKGGVGKSTVTANLALAFQALGARVAVLDADIYGPSQSMMFGLPNKMPEVKNNRIIPPESYGIPVMSFAFFAPAGEAVIWRGAMIGKAVNQMLFDVDWTSSASNKNHEPIDYLFVDLPPGTGDVHISLVHSTPITGAVLVSTPQDMAMADTLKGFAFFRRMEVPVLGIVENMSGFVCPHCGKETKIFGDKSMQHEADQRSIPYLGNIPLDPLVVQRGDSGAPIITSSPQSAVSLAFIKAAKHLAQHISILNHGSSRA